MWSFSIGSLSVTTSPGRTRCDESTIATISWPSTVTWSSSSLPRYSTTSAVPWIVATMPGMLAELEVLGAEAHDDLVARGREGLLVLAGQREVEPALVQLRLPGADRDLDEVHRRAADEAGDEPVLRVVVQVLRGADLLEQALAHDGDPLAHRHRLDLVVGDVDHRGPEALVEARDLGARLHAQLGVEVGQRLVHQEHRGLADDRPAERDALPLAAGELLGLAVEQVLELEDPGRLADALLDLGLGRPCAA